MASVEAVFAGGTGLRDDIGGRSQRLMWTAHKARAAQRWQAVMINMVGKAEHASSAGRRASVTDLGCLTRCHVNVEMIAML